LKYLSAIILSAFLIPVFLNGQNGKVNLDSGLVACYPFNGNANDESGNGNNGTLNGVTLSSDRFGNPNSTYYFNGTNNYITLPNTIKLVNSFSICFWIQTSASNQSSWPWGTFLIDRDACGYSADWSVCMGNGNKIQFNTGSASYVDYTLISAAIINDNTWKFIVIIADATLKSKRIIINTLLDNSVNFNLSPFTNNNLPIYVGASGCETTTHTYFKGKIDDIRFYNRVINTNEIQAIYNGSTCCSGNSVSVNLGKDTTICDTCTLKLHAGNGFAKYLWQDGSTDSVYTLNGAGKYWVQITNNSGCTNSDTIIVSVKVPPQKVICDFDIPDTVCVNQSFNIINKSLGATNYYWNFCSQNISSTPRGKILPNQNNINSPAFITIVKDGTDYYSFSTNYLDGTITRNYFGNSMLNTPVSSNLGHIADLIVGIQIKKENGKWYGFVTTIPTGTGSLVRLEFGNSLLNIPKIFDMGNIGKLDRPHGLIIVKDSGNWYGFTVNASFQAIYSITEFQFGSSLTNIPKGINLGNFGILNYPTGLGIWKENNNWYILSTNMNSNAITRLDFGNSLLNTPKATNLGTMSILNWPGDIKLFKDCEGLHAFITNYNSNTLARLDFINGIKGNITGINLGNIGNLSTPLGISEILIFGDTLCSIIASRFNSLSRLYIPVCNNPSIPSTNIMNPPPISYNKPGVYTISLTIDEGLPTQNTVCKTIVVNDSLKNITISDNEPVCEGGTLNLKTITIAGATYQWAKDGSNIPGATNSTFSIQNLKLTDSGTFTLTVFSPYSCNNKVSTGSKIIIVNPEPKISLGKDTTVCSGESITLKATGTKASSYQWTKNSLIIPSASNSIFNIQHSAFSDSGSYTCIATNSCKSVTSNTMMLTVNSPPVITFFTPPAIKCSRDSIMFKVKLRTSDFGLQTSYQWVRKGNNIDNATKSSYIVSIITPADTGKYYCYISNICGKTSAFTTLSLNTPPFIPDTALNLTSCKGDSLRFTIHPTGTNLSFLWSKDGSIIPRATSNNYQLSTINYNDSGTYSCMVSNTCRTTSLVVATLIVNSCNSISGKVTYDNAAKTPITKSVVYLENSQGMKVDSAKTDITGAFRILNVSNGKYFLLGGKTAMKWGGCNPVDALTVNRYYVGLIKTFGNAIRKTIADVNIDGKINPSDALTINWRYVGLIKKFSIPDWLYETHTVIVNDVSVLQDIKAICAGDVNCSYPK
jgi:hypothetical protein